MTIEERNRPKTARVVGWALSALVSLFLIVTSAMGKFTDWEGKDEMFDQMGWNTEVMVKIGIVEILIAVLFLVPRSAFVAAILLAAYMGGATATHVRVGEPVHFPILIAAIAWVALGLRRPEVFRMALGQPSRQQEPSA